MSLKILMLQARYRPWTSRQLCTYYQPIEYYDYSADYPDLLLDWRTVLGLGTLFLGV